MNKKIIALLMTALLAAGSIPVTAGAADSKENKLTNAAKENDSDAPSGDTKGITDKSSGKASKGSLTGKTKQKETDRKKDTADTEKLSNTKENDEEKQANTAPIAISTLEELQKIGVEEGYPLDGIYELQNDIDAGPKTELSEENQTDVSKITWKPIGTKKNPFTGSLHGNNHFILNLTIAPEEGDTAFFESFAGTVKDLAFINLQVISKTGNAALFAASMNQGEMTNVLLNGKVQLQNPDGTEYVAVNKNEAANVTARKSGTMTGSQNAAKQNKTTEKQIENGQNQASAQSQSAQTGMSETERLKRDITVEDKDCSYENVKLIGELQGELPKGAAQIRTNPEYLSMMKGEKETITAPELPFGLQFQSWEVGQVNKTEEVKAAELELSDASSEGTEVTGKTAGKSLLKAVYQYGETVLSVDSPVVVGEVINEVEELKPVDDVFYGQLEVVAELIPIDGVFPKWMKEKAPNINNSGENEAVVKLYSWEDFKNIGNTEYNPEFTMDANYILMNDITSDGKPFKAIGTKENPFMGSFQGQNFMIDVTLNPEIDVKSEYKGLFGVVK